MVQSQWRLPGRPAFLLGVNYWSRYGGPRMWERFDSHVVRRELAQMRRIGLNTCRCFTFIPSFMPNPPALSSVALTRFRSFLDLCRAEGMYTIPSFLVGHMSGENYDFPGQGGRSPYTDHEILSWETKLIRSIANEAAGQPAIVAYLASNEMPLWGGPASPAVIAQWARTLRQALYRKDPDRPFGLGDAVMNLKGGQNGFEVQSLKDIVDFVGPHTYYADADALRQAYNAEFCLRSLTYLGLPILFEEFGCSGTQASEENQAHYFREVIHSCLSIGAAGALGWCFSDFDLDEEPPYTHHAFELYFGITRSDGSEKPVCDELRRISNLIDQLPFPELQHPRPQAAIIVPSYFNTTYPFSREDRDRMRRVLLQTYALCTSAGLETELVPEDVDLAPYRLVLCPATQKLKATTWRKLLLHARAGNTVYWSYFSGDYNFHQGAWCAHFSELTGCRHQLRYACFDLPADLAIIEGSGLKLSTITQLGQPYPRAYLPIEPQGAEVLARDQDGRPALTRMTQGAGQVIFLNHPWEYYLAEQYHHYAMPQSVELYHFLANRAGLAPAIHCNQPVIQLRTVHTESGSFLWLINHDWKAVETNIVSPAGGPIYGTNMALAEGSTTLEIPTKGVYVYQLFS